MEKETIDALPTYNDATRPWRLKDRRRRRKAFRLFAVAFVAYLGWSTFQLVKNTQKPANILSIEQLQADHAVCASLRAVPQEPSGSRERNQRWVSTTKPTLIRNATIWTGEAAARTSEEEARRGKGYSWIAGQDVFIDNGLIKTIGEKISLDGLPKETQTYDANGRQLTAGIVDMHSHAGLSSVANLQDDVNEMSKDITPFVKSIDGLDPLQPEFEFIKSGGVTTSLILPGSANNMGGEAFVVKLAVGNHSGRAEISQQDMLAAPDSGLRWMKMACGENPKRIYGKVGERGPFSRLGEAWEFRHALEQARDYVQSQDAWCAAADKHGVENTQSYLPQQLQWESLGAVLRGQVRINTHCYTIPDLEAFVRHTNEFKFRVFAFHHAHQTFLIPEVLKRAWGGTPAAALFADNMYYKVEAYTASEQAGKILYENGITPTYVSDNPVLNSQHVVFEAAKAYRYGLPYHAALAGVTSAPAELLGLGNRVGKIKEGFDADVVVWDSDPLSVGAAPTQVWIDGAPQFEDPVILKKPAKKLVEQDLSLGKEMEKKKTNGDVIFKGISHVYFGRAEETFHASEQAVVVIKNGTLSCIGICKYELEAAQDSKTPIIELEDGYITPPFTAFGSALGMIEIDAEVETHDGPAIKDGVTRAVDGLHFGGKQLYHAYEHGVTKAISAPTDSSIDARGISVGFKTNAKHALEGGAIWQDEVALHYILTLSAKDDKTPSISSAIALLRSKLLDAVYANDTAPTGKDVYSEQSYLRKVVKGALPLVLSVHSADTISTLIHLKSSIESAIASRTTTTTTTPTNLRIVLIGGAESHLVAREIAAANIAVVLAPLLPHAQSWDQRRGLTGAPLTNGTAIDALLDAGVLVGIGVEEVWETRDLGLLAGIAFANAEGRLGFRQALDLVGGNLRKMLGVEREEGEEGREWLVWEGAPLEIGARVRGVGDGRGVEIWE
ncbi:amidohydrolase [Polyplosphaeria fusca]|uniref:Amidohydrolase n=1 Tax=Polyplosphaeria fusca TaxID=682080 RepID=A0A9P4V5S2_9PLEO|nr:amidohydrolase [Polyplosphaeria fusca]